MLAELPGQHAVDGVQCHAQQHPHRYQDEQPGDVGQGGQQQAQQDRHHGGGDGNLVSGDTAVVKALDCWAQQGLEARFELVDRCHWKILFRSAMGGLCATGRKNALTVQELTLQRVRVVTNAAA